MADHLDRRLRGLHQLVFVGGYGEWRYDALGAHSIQRLQQRFTCLQLLVGRGAVKVYLARALLLFLMNLCNERLSNVIF